MAKYFLQPLGSSYYPELQASSLHCSKSLKQITTASLNSLGIRALLFGHCLAALLSISLAIFNILPIPALDGGRLLFVIIEWVRRGKRIPPEKEGLVHMIGFALLIAMVLVISYNDILRIVRGESFIR